MSSFGPYWKAIDNAQNQGLVPVRWVVSAGAARDLERLTVDCYRGMVRSPTIRLLGFPIMVDDSAGAGFGLVTRPPAP